MKRLDIFLTVHDRKIGNEAMHMYQLAYCIPGVPKMFPYLSCYFIEIPRYLRKFIKGVYYTIPKLDLCICFISVSARIDFLKILS